MNGLNHWLSIYLIVLFFQVEKAVAQMVGGRAVSILKVRAGAGKGFNVSRNNNGGAPHIALDLKDSRNGWTGFEDENGTLAGPGGVVAAPLNTTQRIRIERNGQVLTACVDGRLSERKR